jgi:hypothetical protein
MPFCQGSDATETAARRVAVLPTPTLLVHNSLDDMRPYDEAKCNSDEVVPLEHAVREIRNGNHPWRQGVSDPCR